MTRGERCSARRRRWVEATGESGGPLAARLGPPDEFERPNAGPPIEATQIATPPLQLAP